MRSRNLNGGLGWLRSHRVTPLSKLSWGRAALNPSDLIAVRLSATRAHHAGSCRHGFTFVETTIAILVMGIMAAVAVPTYLSAVTNYRVNMAARKIIADLNYARAEAQRYSQNRTVQFDTTNNSYTLVNVTDIDNSANAYVVELVEDPFSSTLVSAVFGGDAVVIFDMYGRPDTSGAVVVQTGSVQKMISLAEDGSATATP